MLFAERVSVPGAEPGAAPGAATVPLQERPALRWPGVLALAVLVGAWSVAYTGFAFGQNNNVFHLPIVAALYALPQFAADPFVQSLRGFASGWWMLLEGSERFVPAEPLFAGGLLLSRALTLAGAWAVARQLGLGLKGWRDALGFMLLLSISPLLSGVAYAGHGGLFVPYFTHSELANGLTLFVWWAMGRGRIDLALGLNGLVCFVNGFMGVWNTPALALWGLWLLLRADARARRQHLRRLALGLAVWTALVAPVLARLAGQGGGTVVGAEAPGVYASHLRDYFPYHFFADSISPGHWLGLACVLALGALLIRLLALGRHALAFAWGGSVLVYLCGVVLPWLTQERYALNLHLLRVSVHFHLFAALVLGALTVHAVREAARSGRWGLAGGLLLTTSTVRALLPLSLLVLTRRGAARARSWPRLGQGFGRAALVLLGVSTLALLMTHQLELAAQRADIQQWTALARQIRAATRPEDIVLIPLGPQPGEQAQFGPEIMEYVAQRQVWVDHKRGAAALWAPAYLPVWRQRHAEVEALKTWPERIGYALAQGVAVVVDRCDPALPAGGDLLARSGSWCAVRVPAPAASAARSVVR